MLAALTGDKNQSIDVNSRQCIVFIQGLVEYLSMTEQQAGEIAAAEMFGLATTTVLLSFISERVTWRNFLVLCVAICTLGNFASIGQTDPQALAAIRFITGLGSGGLISLTFTMAGLTERTDRNFGFIVTWVLIYGALGMFVMPSAYQLVGMNGVLAFFGLFCASCFYFIRFLPDSGAAHIDSGNERHYKVSIKTIALAAILIYNIAVGIVWAYLFLVGLEADMQEQAVANALTTSQFLGIAGAFLAVMFETRFGRLAPLMVGIFGGAASIYVLVGQLESAGFWLAVCGFNFLWNLSMPYLLATLAEFDHRGRIVVHGVSMQFVGYAIGPYVAAQLLTRGGFDLVNTAGATLFVVSALVILPGIIAQRQTATT
jgi:predicted MFS family arabinose efflux permease